MWSTLVVNEKGIFSRERRRLKPSFDRKLVQLKIEAGNLLSLELTDERCRSHKGVFVLIEIDKSMSGCPLANDGNRGIEIVFDGMRALGLGDRFGQGLVIFPAPGGGLRKHDVEADGSRLALAHYIQKLSV